MRPKRLGKPLPGLLIAEIGAAPHGVIRRAQLIHQVAGGKDRIPRIRTRDIARDQEEIGLKLCEIPTKTAHHLGNQTALQPSVPGTMHLIPQMRVR